MYTVTVNGIPIQCESATEAIELARQAADGSEPRVLDHPKSEPNAQTRWTERRVREFFELLQGNQRRLIEALLDASDGITDAQLVPMLGLSGNKALAGVFSGLYKNARKVGADPNELYTRETVTIGDRQQNEYGLVDSFRSFARNRKL